VEKLAKALISLKGEFISGHSDWLAINYPSEFSPKEFKVITKLENYSTMARYPLKRKDKLINPLKEFTKSKAKKIIDESIPIFKKLERIYNELKKKKT